MIKDSNVQNINSLGPWMVRKRNRSECLLKIYWCGRFKNKLRRFVDSIWLWKDVIWKVVVSVWLPRSTLVLDMHFLSVSVQGKTESSYCLPWWNTGATASPLTFRNQMWKGKSQSRQSTLGHTERRISNSNWTCGDWLLNSDWIYNCGLWNRYFQAWGKIEVNCLQNDITAIKLQNG